MKTIAIVTPYFGTLPRFYKVWEHTALANSSIDFYVFTDSKEVVSKENIHVVHMSFVEFKSILQKCFEFQIALDTPYKLCDYKPVYGLALQDWLKDYDWWGFCDIDLLLGDIRRFFSERRMNLYDKYCTLGHLSIYRNDDKMNNLFKVKEEGYPALNYTDVYQTNDAMYFDEARGLYTKGILSKIRVCRVLFRDPLLAERQFYHKKVSKESQYVIIWKNGRCYAVDRSHNYTELLYAHFYRRNFEVCEFDDNNISTIKVVPTKVTINQELIDEDFKESESKFYKLKYHIDFIKKSIKRYGIYKTYKRKKWSKDHDLYTRKLEKEYFL